MEKDNEHQLNIKNNRLYFKTTSYKVEEGSMLHSGIYNRELTSSLAAGAVMIAIAIWAYFAGIKVSTPHYVAAIVLFGVLTLLFRKYVFYEEYLEAVIDKSSKTVRVFIKSLISKQETESLDNLVAARKGVIVIAPENTDGIKVVEKIALQHNMAIPGFGEVKEYTTVNLEFDDASTVAIFATLDATEAQAVLDMINNFIGGAVAKTH